MPHYPHIIVTAEADTRRFTSTRSGRGEFNNPPRNRAAHAGKLIQSFQDAAAGAGRNEQVGNGFYTVNTLTLTFESDPGFPLAFDSLDLPRSGVHLLAVSTDEEGRTLATVSVPQNKLGVLVRKLEAYRDKDPNRPLAEGEKKGRDNAKLVESINEIRLATLRQLWTDPPDDYPAPNIPTLFEVWLLGGEGDEDAAAVLRAAQENFGYTVVTQDTLRFVDRSVVLVRATTEQLSRGVEILGIIAEVRKAKRTAAYFDALPVNRQHEHIEQLAARVVPPANDECPVVSLLDTGINHAHPLLAPLVADEDVYTYNPNWGANDTWPHGTGMAGLALYGDLTRLFDNDGPVRIAHRLESMKLIHEDNPHEEHLYGAVTIEGVSAMEIRHARSRVM